MDTAAFWSFLGSAESDSEHPLGRAIVDHAKCDPIAHYFPTFIDISVTFSDRHSQRAIKNVSITSPKKFKALSGRGITCIVLSLSPLPSILPIY